MIDQNATDQLAYSSPKENHGFQNAHSKGATCFICDVGHVGEHWKEKRCKSAEATPKENAYDEKVHVQRHVGHVQQAVYCL